MRNIKTVIRIKKFKQIGDIGGFLGLLLGKSLLSLFDQGRSILGKRKGEGGKRRQGISKLNFSLKAKRPISQFKKRDSCSKFNFVDRKGHGKSNGEAGFAGQGEEEGEDLSDPEAIG